MLMRASPGNRKDQAFTRLDCVALLATLLLVLVVCVPHAAVRSKTRATRIQCLSSLKQIALAFRMWAEQHDQQFPMQVSWQQGGAKELSLRGWVAPNFWAASNELNSPKVVVCPADKKRLPASANFSSLTDRKVSYFLGLDSTLSNPLSILSGDRNLEINSVAAIAGLVSIKDPQTVNWGRKLLHDGAGNVALADGSVHQTTPKSLRSALEASGRTNAVILP